MIYEFRCKECGVITEEKLPISSKKDKTKCKACEGEAERIISQSAFILKGKKWASKEGY